MRQYGEITAKARERGINPQTVHARIHYGMTLDQALSTPVRQYNVKTRKQKKWAATKPKSQLVWNYLLKNRTARPAEVAKATGVSSSHVYRLMNSIGTPREVFEAEAQAANMSTQPPVQEDASYIEYVGTENALKLAGFAATTPPEPQRDGVWTSTIVAVLAAITAVIVWG
jgi:hypothetical protein